MNDTLLFALPSNEHFTTLLSQQTNFSIGIAHIRQFPDQEWYIQIESSVKNKIIYLVSTLDRPDTKILPLLFLSNTLKKLGAIKVHLIAPYLAYMRQDKQFHPGEAITSQQFAQLLSSFLDGIITIDPHLHRIPQLEQIYTLPTQHVLHAYEKIGEWIQNNIAEPYLIGPDAESEQWVSKVAKELDAPYVIIEKTRQGDHDVTVQVPKISEKEKTPVLLDDIVSTGVTLAETIKQLQQQGLKNPVCVVIHPVFAGNAEQIILAAGAKQIISCNTIPHPTNKIDVTNLVAKCITQD